MILLGLVRYPHPSMRAFFLLCMRGSHLPITYNYLALKTITAELPQGSSLAPKACNNLTPKLLRQIKNVRYCFYSQSFSLFPLSDISRDCFVFL